MAFDPHSEDYQRLGLRFAHTLQDRDPFGAARAASGFRRRYATQRDSLPQSDADRAFHLVAEAADLIDYQLPFATDDAVEPLLQSASGLLGEALELDQDCHDARRMKAAGDALSYEGYYRFLADGAADVRAQCLAAREQAGREARAQAQLAAELALRPYLRWGAALASKALVCGRYRRAVEVSRELLELDPADSSDVRFTCALALAKLEDADGLAELERTHPPRAHGRARMDAWTLLARAGIAFRAGNAEGARNALANLLRIYPRAGETLMRQDEYPDGVYARLAVRPGSEDELIIAVSEATVLLQEGMEEISGADYAQPPAENEFHTGTFGSWVMAEPAVRSAAERSAARSARDASRREGA